MVGHMFILCLRYVLDQVPNVTATTDSMIRQHDSFYPGRRYTGT